MCRWLWRCKRNIFLDFLFIISWGSSGSSKMCSWVTLEDNGVDCVAIEMQWLTLSQKLETDTDYVPDFSLVPSLLLDYRKRGIQLLSVRIIKTMGSVVFAFFFFLPHRASMQVPWPGIKPVPPTMGGWSLNHCTAREVPRISCWKRKYLKVWSQRVLFCMKIEMYFLYLI